MSGKDSFHGRVQVIRGVEAACMNCAIRKENGLFEIEKTKDVRRSAPGEGLDRYLVRIDQALTNHLDHH